MSRVRHTVVQPLDTTIRLIALTQNQNAIVDAKDYEWLNQWLWYAHKEGGCFYAVRMEGRKMVYMHRRIMGEPTCLVDHVRVRETLDNRRSNLRLATKQQNNWNCGHNRKNTSGYKGVAWHKGDKRWRAYVKVDGQQKFIGNFMSREDAANARDDAARKLFGEFATMNF